MTLKTMASVKTPYVIISEHQNKLLKGMTMLNKGLTIPLTPPPKHLPSIQQNRGYTSKNAKPIFHNHETLNQSIDYIMEENTV